MEETPGALRGQKYVSWDEKMGIRWLTIRDDVVALTLLLPSNRT